MNEEIQNRNVFTIEDVKEIFFCLNDHQIAQTTNDPTVIEQCCAFLNDSSEELTNDIYRTDRNRHRSNSETFGKNVKSNKKSKSKQKNSEISNSDDEFGNVLLVLSNYFQELQQDFRNIPYTSDSSNMFFVKFNLIQCELVKVKSFLTIKSNDNNDDNNKNTKKTKNKKTDSFQIYNNNITKILNNRLFILQLLHFECFLLKYLKCIELNFLDKSNLSQDVLTNQMQSLFRSYYTLLIKLSYELPVIRMVKIFHQKSSTITTDILLLYFKMINSKFINNDENIESKQKELFDCIINNRSIVIILDYIVILNKIGLLSCNQDMFDKNENFPTHLNKQIDFDLTTKRVEDFLNNSPNKSPQMNLIYFGFLLLPHLSVGKFIEKSPLRSRTIVMLSSLLLKCKNVWDCLASAILLYPSIIKLLEHCNNYHIEICKGSVLNLEKEDILALKRGDKLIEKDIRLKTYLSILRDIHGILTLFLVYTETTITNRYLCHLGFSQCFFKKFMNPFVCSLNGTENSDPESYQMISYGKIFQRSEAYLILKLYRKQFETVIKNLNRVVIISSIIIQRLLPPLVLPIVDHYNPFRFPLSTVNLLDNNLTSDNDLDLDDEDSVHYPISDEDYNDSDILNESELDDSNNENNNNENLNNVISQKIVEKSFLESYLCFFPESTFLNNDRNVRQLSCSCNELNFNSQIDSSKTNDIENFTLLSQNLASNNDCFNWKEIFIKEYDSTKTVIPKVALPKPDLNFPCKSVQTNSIIHPMTYPFLENTIRYKNYYHIKLLNHIRERLENDMDPIKLKLIYDIAQNSNIEDLNCLKFESRFECGNLRQAYLKSSNENEEEYILLLNTDINTTTHTQWFYFSVSQMKINKKYRFKIINCDKKSILYNIGQQPLFYSTKEFETSSKTWQRLDNYENFHNTIAYYRNHFIKNNSERQLFKGKPYYTLEFTFKFPFNQDECYFAFNTPFSFSFLKTCISYWSFLVDKFNNQSVEDNSKIFFASQTLCSTLKGNDLPLITITSNVKNENLKKHYIMITARVHPAESNSSWVLKGFIDFLLSPHEDRLINQNRKKLLDRFIFKIVPMLNPDGVINGSTRTDLQTQDLNRHWGDPSPLLHPTIYHSKMFLQCLDVFSQNQNPVAFLDLHGHSRRYNIFSYSCFPLLSWKKSDRKAFLKQSFDNNLCQCHNSVPQNNSGCQFKYSLQNLKSQQENNAYFQIPSFATLPLILQYQQAPAFEMNNCSFVIQEDREQTARIVAWRQLHIPLAYTIECTSAGCDQGPYVGMNLSSKQLEEMGYYIATTFNFIEFIYCSQKHYPVICWPKKPIFDQGDDDDGNNRSTVIDTLLSRCCRSKTPEKSNSTKQKKLKKFILESYPEFLEMKDYFK